MADQPTASTVSPASSPSVPPSSSAPVDRRRACASHSTFARRLTDTVGLVLAGYLVSKGAVSGTRAALRARVALALAAVAPSRESAPGLAGPAQALASPSLCSARPQRGRRSEGVAVVGAGVLGLAACLGGCAAVPIRCSARSPRASSRAPRNTARASKPAASSACPMAPRSRC